MLRKTLRLLFLWAVMESVRSRSCSPFFCREERVSGSHFGADPGKPLMLTPYLEQGKIEEAKKLSLVGPLPAANVKSYSGYLTVNKTYNSNLFFWFFPAQTKPETAPVLLWLQGGPGASGMFGLFVEHGPFFVHKNLTLGYRDFPWTSKYSVLYIDSPLYSAGRNTYKDYPLSHPKLEVGTGWSFTEDDKGFAKTQDDVGRDLYSALTQFFQIFSEFQSNPFYVTGESYAGKYVPTIGYYIHKNNPFAKVKINFTGVAIGGGFCDPELMLGGYADYFYQMGLVNEMQRQFVKVHMDEAVELIQEQRWMEAFLVLNTLLHNSSSYPSYFQIVTGCTNYFNYMQCQKPPDFMYFVEFVKLPEVRHSIHVGNIPFSNGSDVENHLIMDAMKSIKPWLGVLMDHYRVLIYNGQLDISVPVPVTELFLPTVNWSGAEEYKNAESLTWKVRHSDTEVAGYVRQVREFFQVIVRGGGHILPYDQPERSFDMIDRFISRGFSSH